MSHQHWSARGEWETHQPSTPIPTLNLTPFPFSSCLGDGSRIAIVTSLMGSISDNGSGGFYAYRASKAAVNQVAKSMANDLEAKGIAVHLWHPGMVETDMLTSQGWSGQPVESAVIVSLGRVLGKLPDELSPCSLSPSPSRISPLPLASHLSLSHLTSPSSLYPFLFLSLSLSPLHLSPPPLSLPPPPPPSPSQGLLDILDTKNDLSTTGTFWHGNYGNGIKPCPW